jgi:hypothetical protein
MSDLLIAGRDKVDRYRLLLAVLHKFQDSDLRELTDTDSGRALGQVDSG